MNPNTMSTTSARTLLLLAHPAGDGRFLQSTPSKYSFLRLKEAEGFSNSSTVATVADGRSNSPNQFQGSPPGGINLAIEEIFSGDSVENRPAVCASWCPAVDVDRAVLGYASGNAYIVGADRSIVDIEGKPEDGIVSTAWDPNKASWLSLASKNSLRLVDVQESSAPVTVIEHMIGNISAIQYHAAYSNRLMIGLEPPPTAAGTFGPPMSPGPSTPTVATSGLWMIDPRTKSTDAVQQYGDKKERALGELICCHPAKDYVVTAGTLSGKGGVGPRDAAIGGRSVVQLWDLRVSSRPVLTRKGSDRISQLLWCGDSENLSVVARIRDESILRAFDLIPVRSNEGSNIGFNSAPPPSAYSRTSSHSDTTEAFSVRLVEKRNIYTGCPLHDISWLSLAPTGRRSASPIRTATFADQASNSTNLALPQPLVRRSSFQQSVAELSSGCVDAILGLNAREEFVVVNVQRGPAMTQITPLNTIASFEHTLLNETPAPARDADLYLNDSSSRMMQRIKAGLGIDPKKNQEVAYTLRDTHLFSISRYLEVMHRLKLTNFPGVMQLFNAEGQPQDPTTINRLPSKPVITTGNLGTALGCEVKAENIIYALAGWLPGFEITSIARLSDEEMRHREVGLAIYQGNLAKAADLLVATKDSREMALGLLLRSVSTHKGPIPWEGELDVLCHDTDDVLTIALSFLVTSRESSPQSSSVFYDQRVPLFDRIALSVKYLSGRALVAQLTKYYDEQVQIGSVKQFFFSGLHADSALSMQQMVDWTGDVQLAAVSFASVKIPDGATPTPTSTPTTTKPGTPLTPSTSGSAAGSQFGVKLALWKEWNAAYRDWLNTWGMWSDRARYDVSVQRLDRQMIQESTAGATGAKPLQSSVSAAKKSALLNPRVTLQCLCTQQLHGTAPSAGANFGFSGRMMGGLQQQQKNITPCSNPDCRHPGMPVCSVCCLRLGSKDVSPQDPKEWFVWCTACSHGGHLGHIQDWFSKHKKCPVDDCKCFCKM